MTDSVRKIEAMRRRTRSMTSSLRRCQSVSRCGVRDETGARGHTGTKRKAQELVLGFQKQFPGNVLLSHAVSREVPSGLKGLTAVFGMGTGVAPSLESPGKPLTVFRNQEKSGKRSRLLVRLTRYAWRLTSFGFAS